jgi:hypothetical protein
MKFTFFFSGSPLAPWIRIHNTASLVAVVMNRNVNYIRKVLYMVVCSPLLSHHILTRGSGSGTDQDLATQNNTDPVGFRFGSAILEKSRGYRYSLYRGTGTYLYVLCHMLLHCMTQRVRYYHLIHR